MIKLTKDEINDVVEFAHTIQLKYEEYRWGQTFFNALYRLYPQVADKIRGTDKDPFYNDKKVSECIEFISDASQSNSTQEICNCEKLWCVSGICVACGIPSK